LARDFVVRIARRETRRRPYVFSFNDQIDEVSRMLWKARYDELPHARCGSELLEWFKKVVRLHPRIFGLSRCGPERVQNILFRFSYLLNVYADQWQIDQFVGALNFLICDRESGPKSADGRRLAEVVKNFLDHHDPKLLLCELENIKLNQVQ